MFTQQSSSGKLSTSPAAKMNVGNNDSDIINKQPVAASMSTTSNEGDLREKHAMRLRGGCIVRVAPVVLFQF